MSRSIRVSDETWKALRVRAAESGGRVQSEADFLLAFAISANPPTPQARVEPAPTTAARLGRAGKAARAEAATSSDVPVAAQVVASTPLTNDYNDVFCQACHHFERRHLDGKACDYTGCNCRRFRK